MKTKLATIAVLLSLKYTRLSFPFRITQTNLDTPFSVKSNTLALVSRGYDKGSIETAFVESISYALQ